jgi:hypothetical protein
MALKMLRGEDVTGDIDKELASFSPMEREMLVREGLELQIRSIVKNDPTLELFEDENGKSFIRRVPT